MLISIFHGILPHITAKGITVLFVVLVAVVMFAIECINGKEQIINDSVRVGFKSVGYPNFARIYHVI